MADEHVFLNEGSLFVSNSRVVVGGTTYSLANITSVRKDVTPPNRGCAISLVALAAFIVLSSLAALTQDLGLGLVVLLMGCGLGALGMLWFRSLKPAFHVMAASASGEIQALSSKDEKLVDRVVSALSEAIVYRG